MDDLVIGDPGVNAVQPVKVWRAGIERVSLRIMVVLHVPARQPKQLNVGRNNVQVSHFKCYYRSSLSNCSLSQYYLFLTFWRFLPKIHKPDKWLPLITMKGKNPSFLQWHISSLYTLKIHKTKYHTEKYNFKKYKSFIIQQKFKTPRTIS